MAWTDAARAASAAVRKAHAKGRVSISGKRAKPMRWYHGGGPVRGNTLNGKWAFATSHFPMAVGFAQSRAKYAWPGTSERRATTYLIKPSRIVWQNKRNVAVHSTLFKLRGKSGHFELRSTLPLRTIRALPRARGRAARGHY